MHVLNPKLSSALQCVATAWKRRSRGKGAQKRRLRQDAGKSATQPIQSWWAYPAVNVRKSIAGRNKLLKFPVRQLSREIDRSLSGQW
jgi:hypothetical protein